MRYNHKGIFICTLLIVLSLAVIALNVFTSLFSFRTTSYAQSKFHLRERSSFANSMNHNSIDFQRDVNDNPRPPIKQYSSVDSKVVGLPVLMYHRIDNTPDPFYLWVPINNFKAQMQLLYENGYHSITLSQLEAYLKFHKSLPSKPILITFDDGNKDNVTNALPILHQYNFTAALFVAGTFVGKGGAVTISDIQTLASNGWDIANHTFDHVQMATLSPTAQKQELDMDNTFLQTALPGRSFRFFAYPTGNFNASVVNTLKADGFTMAFTTIHGWVRPSDNPFLLPRIYVGPYTSLAQFRVMVSRPFNTGKRMLS